jgi:beta-N-acetylhexosaminidase
MRALRAAVFDLDGVVVARTKPDPEVFLAAAPFHLDAGARAWVVATRDGMSLEEKVGQLFCLIDLPATYEHVDADFAVAEPGGYMRRPAPSTEIADLTRKARIPLLVTANLESGADMLATDLTAFGSPLQVAATGEERNAYRLGQVCGTEAWALGCTWGFSPIVDMHPVVLGRQVTGDVGRGCRSAGCADEQPGAKADHAEGDPGVQHAPGRRAGKEAAQQPGPEPEPAEPD